MRLGAEESFLARMSNAGFMVLDIDFKGAAHLLSTCPLSI